MLIRVIPVSIILCISYASMFDNLINDDYSNVIYPQNKNPVFYDFNENILQNLEALNQKMEDFEKKIPDKIENSISRKLQYLEQYMSQKLKALEERIADKIAEVNQRLDKLPMKQHNFDKNTACNIQNTVCEINVKKLEGIEKKLSQLHNNTYLKFEELSEKIMELKPRFSERWTAPESLMSDTEIKMEPKLDSLKQIAFENLVKTFNSESDAIIKSIFDKNRDYDVLTNTPAKNSKELVEDSKKNNNDLGNKPQVLGDCKTRVVRGYDFKPIRLDSDTPLNYVTLENDGAGLRLFEINFAIKSDGMVMIPLSSVPNPGTSTKYFAIGIGDGHAYSWIRMVHPYSDNDDSVYLGEFLDTAATRNILSPTTFKEFYIKISNDTLEFGERSTEAPILSYTDERFSTIKYIGFTSWGDYYDAEYLYDCSFNSEDITTVNMDMEENFYSTPFESERLIASTDKNTEDIRNSTLSELENTTSNLEVTSLKRDVEEENLYTTPFESESLIAGSEEDREDDLINSTSSGLEDTTSSLEENLKYLLGSYEEEVLENLDDDEFLKIEDVWDCMTRMVRGYDFKPIRLDRDTPLKFATIETDSADLKHFEMDVSIKSDGMVMIPLSSEPNPKATSNYFAIGVGDGHAYSWIRVLRPTEKNDGSVYLSRLLQQAATRDILSPAVFKLFHIKIYNNTLEFGERGTEAPILSYTDDRFSTIKYIGFTSWGDHYVADYLYDCPTMAAYFGE